ncbi:ATP-grasp domain-containing protein [Streptomyces sp. NPDC087420]|uniref:ATP-grasp domain-containing protein n=1 Tax=Streptomyces sp. NPDC087420 TaxID=3365785 RepID=UPI0038386026
MTGRTLFLPPRTTPTGTALAAAAARRGMRVRTLHDRRVPEEHQGDRGATLHAGPGFADLVAPELGLGLLEADEGRLAAQPYQLTCRRVELMPVARARQLRVPAFMKPPNDKSFPARVYTDGSRLPGPDAVDDDVPVLVSDIVTFTAEFRLFMLDGEVVTGSRYAVRGVRGVQGVQGVRDVVPLESDPRGADVRDFAGRLFAAGLPALPSAVVVDVGTVDGRDNEGPPQERWAVVEANAAWAGGHDACDADRALDVVLGAARAVTAPDDVPFLRPRPSVRRSTPRTHGKTGR